MRAVNLIPAEQRTRGGVGAGRSQGAAYAVLVALAGVAVLAVLYGVASRKVSSETSKLGSLNQQVQRAEASASSLGGYTNFAALRQQRQSAVETLVDTRFDWSHTVHEFARVLPRGVAITNLEGKIASGTSASGAKGGASALSTSSSTSTSTSTSSSASSSASPSSPGAAGSGSGVTSATPPGSAPAFTMAGCATSQSVVAQVLNRLRLIDGVNEVTLQSSTKSSTSGGGGASSAGCPAGDPTFSVQISFDPLPAPASQPSAQPVANTTATEGEGSK